MENTESPQWESLGLSNEALELIRKAGFARPTAVQAQAIPAAIEGADIIASSQTGTGKTASFVLPMVEKFKGREGTFGIVLCPTREIALQTQQTLELFGTPRGVRSIVLIGGVAMTADARAIDTYPQVIVATPGRLCDHLDRGNIWLDYVEVVVLDEADRMLDMGFAAQLSRIMEDVPKKRQTLLFSATITPPVEKLARRILHEPEMIAIGRPTSAATTVEQRLMWMEDSDKIRQLRRLLRHEKGSVIVFARSKDGATRMYRSLHSAGFYDVTYIHSDRPQAHREQALEEFKSGKFRILIATDVAGRGIHIDNVAHVVNYDLPLEPEDYVHRIGRTGRAGASGTATSFATRRDRPLLSRIEKILGKSIPEIRDFERAEIDESDVEDSVELPAGAEVAAPKNGAKSADQPGPKREGEGGERKRRRRRRGRRGGRKGESAARPESP
ncbi:MAG: DEAD/DEAH box helicase [Oligoflexia bacterium]|nr:DEAD/DEAH box helicase [Oligoflexia bacterium]